MTKRTFLYETEIRSASREEDNNFTGEPSSPEQENYQLATRRSKQIKQAMDDFKVNCTAADLFL